MRSNFTLLFFLLLSFFCLNAQINDRPVSISAPEWPNPLENRCSCVDVIVENSQQGVYYTVRNLSDKMVLSESLRGNGQNLKIAAGALNSSTTLEVFAQNLDKSLQFDGINDYFLVSVPLNNHIPLTITARIKTTDTDGVIMGFTGPGVNNYQTFSVYQGHLRFSTGNGTMEYVDGVTSISNNLWHHVALVIESNQVKLYVDGNLDKTASYTRVPTSTDKNSIGGAYLNDFLQSFYAGSMDDLTVWSSALDATAISNLVTTNPAGGETNLKANYNFDGMPDTALLNTNVTFAHIYGKPYGIGTSASIIDQVRDSLILFTFLPVTVNPNNTYSFPLIPTCIGKPFFFQVSETNANYEYYLRNDADNSILDGPVSNYGNNLGLSIASLQSTQTLNVFMRETDQSLTFDGSDDYIQISPMIPLTDTFTVMAQIKSTDGSGTIFGWGAAGVNNYAVFEIYQSHLRFACGSNSTNKVNIDGIAVINDGNWHHVTLVKQGNNVCFYVDGKLDKCDAVISVPVPTYSSIGAGYLNGIMQDNFAGTINDLSVWNKVLTSNRIRCFSNTKPWGSDKGLVALYNFNKLPDTNLKNRTQDTYHGNFYNMAPLTVVEPASSDEIQLSQKVTPVLSANCDNGAENIDADFGITVFPNPFDEVVLIKNPKQAKLESIKVTTTNGKLIAQKENVSDNKIEFGLQGVDSGIYFITITLENKVITRKIIKK